MCERSNCVSTRIATVNAKCSDMCQFILGNIDHEGYVPRGVGIGGGDYIEFDYCLDCGQIQGHFPVEDPELD